MAVLKHEGSVEILYRSYPMPTGAGLTSGYLARPTAWAPIRWSCCSQASAASLLRSETSPAVWPVIGYSVLVPDLTRGDHPGARRFYG